MSASDQVIIGVAWYRPEQWSLLRSLAVDADKLEETHEQWLAMATRTIAELQREGMTVRKVDIDVRELSTWCQAQGQPLDGDARATYASQKMQLDEMQMQRRKLRRRRGH